MKHPVSRATCVALVSLAAAGAAVPTAGAARAVPVTKGPAGEVLAVSPDGTVLATSQPKDGLAAVGLGSDLRTTAPVALGVYGGEPPAIGTAADGSAAIAAPSDGNDHLALGFRPAGGAFAPFQALGGTDDPNTADTVATGGGVVLAGSSTEQQAIVLRRAADGTRSAPIVLQTLPKDQTELSFDVQVAVDGTGRGLVAWTSGTGAARHTSLATIAADGALGPVVRLPGRASEAGADAPSGVRVAVAADGTGSVAWRDGSRTLVAPASTTGGADLRAPVPVSNIGSTALTADGAAVVVSARRKDHRVSARVASRAAGKPFTAVRTVEDVDGGVVSVGFAKGRWAAAFTSGAEEHGLHPSTLLRGSAGGAVSAPITLPTTSISQLALQVATPGGTPVVFARANREIEDRDGGVRSTGTRTETWRVASGRNRTAKASYRLRSSQRLGRPSALRLTIRCRTACSYRVYAPFTAKGQGDGLFDVARTASRGTHRIAVPYQGPSSGDQKPERLKRAVRARVTIAVDDASGGESVWRRTVRVAP